MKMRTVLMPAVTIGDGELSRTFDGTLIAESKTDKWPRWIEFRIWKLDGGQGYAFYRAGKSVLYHTADTRCYRGRGMQAGKPATVDDLPDDAAPCSVCQPPEPAELGDDEPIRFETDRITLNMHATPRGVIEDATTVPGTASGSGGRVFVSAPVADLLAQAATRDPAFAREWDPRTRALRADKAAG